MRLGLGGLGVGRSGGAPPVAWTPALITTVSGWYRADSYAAGTATEKAVGGPNMAQATGSARPTLVASWRNARPAMYFDGADFLTTATNLCTRDAFTMWAVLQLDAITGFRPVCGVGEFNGMHLAFNGAGAFKREVFCAGSGTPADGLGTTNAELWIVTRTGGNLKFYLGATEQALSLNSVPVIPTGGSQIGTRTSGGSGFFLGHIAEVGFATAAISSDEITALNTYATAYYAL
jgi:hypothetical protein